MPSKDTVLHVLVCALLPLPSCVSLWSPAKHQDLPFTTTRSAFHFPSAAWGATASASYMAKKKKATLFLPKNNLSFKCPLQRGWSNLSWTLRRQKKVIERASHYLQQGRQRLADAAEAVRELFLLLALREERSGPGGLLWAIRILLWIMNTHRISLRAWMCPGTFVLLWFSPSSH